MERPKVRFSQTPDIPSDHRETHTPKDATCKGKVIIKSIVPANFPIKILDNGKRVLVTDPTNASKIFHSNQICNPNNLHPCLYTSPKGIDDSESRNSSSNFELESSFDQNLVRHQVDAHKSVASPKELEECIDGLEKISIDDSSSKLSEQTQSERNSIGSEKEPRTMSNIQPTLSNIPCITCGDSTDEDSDIEVIKIINTHRQPNPKNKKKSSRETMARNRGVVDVGGDLTLEMNTVDSTPTKAVKSRVNQKSDKENSFKLDKPLNKITERVPIQKTKVLRDATNPSSNMSGPLKQKKYFKKNKQKLFAKPPLKTKDDYTIEKFPHSQVKKSTVFNVEKKNPKVIVEAESAISKGDEKFQNHAMVNEEKTNISSKNLLSRPEYNSTINIVKKLKELQAEKPKYDLENLPEIYRSFVQNKVSAALEFGPYETVYKDLISLSIDENQLPPRLTRSKDPEPRDRDIMPGLSDFFYPKHTRQYLTVAHPTTPCPTNVDPLSAFTISNRIRMWKISRNNF
ncbi:hypothetical protein QAD02_022200 [Eretmocerus hayati]|uniref:Uncharacterized protein n=1 Tax=Eretmocerus hayati TaxID=131215 RepID=A0ACC2PSA9_9HYME|nr:hypothetical protein QAD02_022200 [Eretmocerus hayati]